jgi:Leucine-rich repeat (LRR) protein
LGDIASNALISKNLKSLLLRNNLISKIEGMANVIKGLGKLNSLVELELYDNKIGIIEGLEELTNL